MAKVRQVLRHLRVEHAKGTRNCRRNRAHSIRRGEPCLLIRDDVGPYSRTYCSACALPILKQCAADLRVIRDFLYGAPSDIGGAPPPKGRPTQIPPAPEQCTVLSPYRTREKSTEELN